MTLDDLPNFVRHHLTDLLFVPAMSLFALIIIRFIKRDSELKVHWLSVGIQVILVSIYFEWYLPNNSPKGHIHIADWVDCIMYIIRGGIFILTQPYL